MAPGLKFGRQERRTGELHSGRGNQGVHLVPLVDWGTRPDPPFMCRRRTRSESLGSRRSFITVVVLRSGNLTSTILFRRWERDTCANGSRIRTQVRTSAGTSLAHERVFPTIETFNSFEPISNPNFP